MIYSFSLSLLTSSFLDLETLLNDNDCPQEIRLASAGKHCMIAYKRFDAKIAWPKT